jgi:hypothetical protein
VIDADRRLLEFAAEFGRPLVLELVPLRLLIGSDRARSTPPVMPG